MKCVLSLWFSYSFFQVATDSYQQNYDRQMKEYRRAWEDHVTKQKIAEAEEVKEREELESQRAEERQKHNILEENDDDDSGRRSGEESSDNDDDGDVGGDAVGDADGDADGDAVGDAVVDAVGDAGGDAGGIGPPIPEKVEDQSDVDADGLSNNEPTSKRRKIEPEQAKDDPSDGNSEMTDDG
jgi:hypothetical protein